MTDNEPSVNRPSLPPWSARLDDPVEQDRRRAELEDELERAEFEDELRWRRVEKGGGPAWWLEVREAGRR